MARKFVVEIVADTRKLRAALIRAQIRTVRSPWRRVLLRIALWRVEREEAP